MSYEEDYRIPYKAKCLCGKGYLTYEDPYQVVIAKEVYDKHKNDSKYHII